MENFSFRLRVIVTNRIAVILLRTLQKYRSSLYTATLPMAMLPILLALKEQYAKCVYAVSLMTGLWIFDAIPHTVISLLPQLLFPLSGILDSKTTASCYFSETNLLNVATLVIAMAMENSKLLKRLAMHVTLVCRGNVQLMHLLLMMSTMFISMFIPNLAAIIVVVPIVKLILIHLDVNGVCNYFKSVYKVDESVGSSASLQGEAAEAPKLKVKNSFKFTSDEQFADLDSNDHTRPSSTTVCFYLSVGFAATIGGIGMVTGSPTNHLLFDFLKETYPMRSSRLHFLNWFLIASPIMLVSNLLVCLCMQAAFLGLFRPKSAKGKSMKANVDLVESARGTLATMKAISFVEVMSLVAFLLASVLIFFRNPVFMDGWSQFVSREYIGDSTVAMAIVLFLFLVPALEENFGFVRLDPAGKRYRPLISWPQIQRKLLWMSVFVVGSSYALAEAFADSGLSKRILATLQQWIARRDDPVYLLIGLATTLLVTSCINDEAVVAMLLPVYMTHCRKRMCDPVYAMMAVTLFTSYSFVLQIGSPVNAIVCGLGKVPSRYLLLTGLFVTALTTAVTLALFPVLFKAAAP